MPSENYRYYCLDSTGQLHSAEWFYADDDLQAVAKIEAEHADAHCEVWQGNRLVAKLLPKRRSA